MKFSLTRPNIAKIAPGELPGAMWQFYLGYSAIKQTARDGRDWREFHLSLPRGMRLVHTYMRFDGDVLNGGLGQYFGNHSPDEVYEDLAALKAVGATESAKILEEAIALYSDYGWPSDNLQPRVPEEPGDHPEIERLDDMRCNEAASRRDYAIFNAYLQQHLEECLMPTEVECPYLEEFLRAD